MPQVPYSPVPEAQLNLQPTPEMHVQTSPEVFGGAVGQGLSHLGQVTTEAGNEIFARASAMQQLKNETDGRRSGVSFEAQAGQLYAKFKEQAGNNAGPEAYTAFQKQLTELREKTRGELTNPAAQKLYDADSYGLMGKLFMYGAAHSATELKHASMDSHKMALEQAANTVQLNPMDEDNYKRSLDIAQQSAEYLAQHNGLNAEDTTQQIAIAKSGVTVQRINALSATNLPAAKGLFDRALKDGALRGEDITKLQNGLHNKENTVGSKNVADGIRDGTSMALGESIVSMDRAKGAILGNESGGNYAAVGPVTRDGDHAYGKYQVKGSSLPGFLRQAGLPSMTPDEFIKNPAAQEKVFETIFSGYMQKYGSFNKAAVAWFGGEGAVGKVNARGDGYTTVPEYLAKANAALYKSATITDKVGAGRAQAEKIDPTNPIFSDMTEQRILTQHTQEDRFQKQQEQERWGAIDSGILNNLGKGPMTIETLKADPKTAEAIDQLTPQDHVKLLSRLHQAAGMDNTISDQRTTNYQQLIGKAYTNEQEFLKVDPWDKDLTANDRKDILTKQKQIRSGKKLDDPQITSALNNPNIKQALEAAGIDRKGPDFLKYSGALADEINQARASGRPLSYKDIEDIGHKLLQEQVTASHWYGDSKEKIYAIEPPKDWVERNRPVFEKKRGYTPSDEEMQRLYSRKVFQDTYGKKAEK